MLRGADMRDGDAKGVNPFMLAALYGRVHNIKAMLSAEAEEKYGFCIFLLSVRFKFFFFSSNPLSNSGQTLAEIWQPEVAKRKI